MSYQIEFKLHMKLNLISYMKWCYTSYKEN